MLGFEVAVKNGLWRTKNAIINFFKDEEGDTNLITIIVVLVIVMGLAVVFRKNIATLANNIWNTIFSKTGEATGGNAGTAEKFN